VTEHFMFLTASGTVN